MRVGLWAGAAQAVEGVAGGGVEGADVFAQVGMMLVGAADPDPGGQRGCEAAAQGAQEGCQSRSIGDLIGRQVGQQNTQSGHEEQRHADAHEQLHHRHVFEIHVGVEACTHEAAQPHRQERQPGQ